MISKALGETNEVKVVRRLVAPRQDGSYVVPLEIVEKFKDIAGGGRAEVMRLYQDRCNRDKDWNQQNNISVSHHIYL